METIVTSLASYFPTNIATYFIALFLFSWIVCKIYKFYIITCTTNEDVPDIKLTLKQMDQNIVEIKTIQRVMQEQIKMIQNRVNA